LTFYNNYGKVLVLLVREQSFKKERKMRETEFDLTTDNGVYMAMKQRKVDLHEDAKASADIFRKHGMVVRVVYRKHYDPYLALYAERSRDALNDPMWIESAHTAMRESIENGLTNDVFFRHDPHTNYRGELVPAYNSTGISNNLRHTIERRMRHEEAAA
jgi:hypothetical protein